MPENKMFFDDVAENQELPSFQETVTRTHFVRYAGAGGDMNPIHHDEEFAKAAGLPSVFAMGMMQGSYLSRIITDWAGVGHVKSYKVKFQSMVWPNDTLTFKGRVSRCYIDNTENLVDCDLMVTNQRDETVIIGNAVLRLPVRS